MSKKIKAEEYMNWDKTITNETTPLEAFGELKRQMGSWPYTRCDLSGGIGQTTTFLIRDTKLYEIIETALKALEIIKEKRVNVDVFLIRVKKDTDYKEYKRLCCLYKIMTFSEKELTQEEYDLLKEVLLWVF